jgi:HEAT repeat protein
MIVELSPEQMSAFVAAIDRPDHRRQAEAVRRLGINPGQVRVRQVMGLLSHRSAHVREFVIALMASCELRGEAYPAIQAALQDESAYVRVMAANALRHAPKLRNWPDSRELLSVFVGALSSADDRARIEAGRALNQMGADAKAALPHLLAKWSDPCEYVRIQVARATFHVGASAEEALPVLQQLLADEHALVRSYAETALGRLRINKV